jgi:Eco29kI restriction endonuclease
MICDRRFFRREADMSDADAGGDPHEFVFKLDKAIRTQVVERLESSPMLPLKRDVAPKWSGVYALYFKDTLVYIGKASKGTTKSKRTLRDRLNEHVGKLGNRENLTLADMSCRFLTIESDWFVWAAEFALINKFTPEWNGSGYGSKTPGKGRPGTHRVSRWNQLFPMKGHSPNPAESEDADEPEED